MLHTNSKLGKNMLSSCGKNDVYARRTTHDDGRQFIAIGHLTDSGDLEFTR